MYEFTYAELAGSVRFNTAADAVEYFGKTVVDPQTGFMTTLSSLLDGPSAMLLAGLQQANEDQK